MCSVPQEFWDRKSLKLLSKPQVHGITCLSCLTISSLSSPTPLTRLVTPPTSSGVPMEFTLSRQPLPLDYVKEMGVWHLSLSFSVYCDLACVPASSSGTSLAVFSSTKTLLRNRSCGRYGWLTVYVLVVELEWVCLCSRSVGVRCPYLHSQFLIPLYLLLLPSTPPALLLVT